MNTREKLEDIKNQDLSAVENTEQILNKINEIDDEVNAFIEINSSAVSDAEAIDEKIDNEEKIGKLAGLTIAVKANINTKGLRASCASKTLENYISTYDAEVIKRIRSEDGIIIGINNMDEFACGSSGETSFFGPTQNPVAKKRVPGGSSSGGGAAVASGMCDIALGTDTGGSIRNPASHCGVVGLKPTYGLVPRHGLIDLAMSFDQIGPLSPDVYGAALMMEVIAGKNPRECIMLDVDQEDYLDKINDDLDGMKIGISSKFKELTRPDIMSVIDEAIDQLSENGAEVIEVELPNLEKAMPTYYLIVSIEFFSGTRKFDGRKYGRDIEESCGDEVLRRIIRGKHISQKEFKGKFYKRALQVRTLIKRELNEALKEADVLVGPTVPKLPHKIGMDLTPEEMYAYDYLTVPTNLGGLCGGVVKAGEVNGVPVGLQVQGASLDEHTVLKVMNALEEIR